jgi:hypothetical protein
VPEVGTRAAFLFTAQWTSTEKGPLWNRGRNTLGVCVASAFRLLWCIAPPE